MIDAGVGAQLLISQGVGHLYYLSSYGGWGFAHVLTQFKGMLEVGGVPQEWYVGITRSNPAVMLTGDRGREAVGQAVIR